MSWDLTFDLASIEARAAAMERRMNTDEDGDGEPDNPVTRAELEEILKDLIIEAMAIEGQADTLSGMYDPMRTSLEDGFIAAFEKSLILNPIAGRVNEVIDILQEINEELGGPISDEVFETTIIPDPLAEYEASL